MAAIRKNSPFDENEMKWIVLNYGNSLAIEVRRKFIIEFSVPGKRQQQLYDKQFSQLRDRFARHGTMGTEIDSTIPTTVMTDDNVQDVKTYFEDNPHSSITSAASVQKISPSSVYRIFRKKIKLEPYRIKKVQTITEVNKQQRINFC